ncbi:hypothetical protein ASPSYDRAFT_149081 [Aspergillus sydowii CBS 593.65]|uniref:Arrestin-like N-terminal domain-containing protein n=1 Tax=Aspergillus sydowii CBS 593.65 TaxID=1036612 RepID=A0A1L9TJ92_9EURO|nr:uncharacterized protein ASPSYDRAFT_149081 [Aspergillus sydowii CBS 593.65]OJJ59485.1 hypothetical protein ASPSYDRAFT_149081 [Aspergillus sydowii CBS 593.65]
MSVAGPSLKIVLDRDPIGKPYKPGDTISGQVCRTLTTIAPEANLTVTLQGRSTSKVSDTRVSLDCLGPPVSYVLLAGAPVHIPRSGEGGSWPFAITIPPLVSDIRSPSQKKRYPAPGGTAETPFPPPGTFRFNGESVWSGEGSEASIDYYVEARLDLIHQCNGRNVRDTLTAKATIDLRNVNLGPPITDFSMRTSMAQRIISTYRLIPGVGELSFSQNLRQSLNSSKVPRFTFKVILSLPSTLQVGNGNTIPISVTIVPNSQGTSEIVHGVPQEIFLKAFRLKVKASTTVRAERYSDTRTTPGRNVIPFGAVSSLGPQGRVISIVPGIETESTPLNIGEMLMVNTAQSNLHPDFLTYNISRTNSLRWELDGSVAGEDFSLGSSTSVKILPAPGEIAEPAGLEGLGVLAELEEIRQIVESGGEEPPGYSKVKDPPPAYNL